MEQTATDNSVWTGIQALRSGERVIPRGTERAVTPFGGVAVFAAYPRKTGLAGKVREHMPVQWRPPDNIDPAAAFIAFPIAVLAGAKRFAHANWLRGGRALQALLGMSRFPCDGTIRNLFRQFGMGSVERLFAPLIERRMQLLEEASGALGTAPDNPSGQSRFRFLSTASCRVSSNSVVCPTF